MSETSSGTTVQLCGVDDVAEGDPYVGDIEGTTVALFEVDGEYFAIENTCPHQGGPLAQGKIEDECVYCPWHGWQFDLESGEHVHGKKTATTYEVVVEDDTVHVVV